MHDIPYVGETLWPGHVGHLCIILSFVSALFAAAAYFLSTRHTDTQVGVSWKTLGRIGFTTHGVTTLSLIGVLIYAMVNHMYEFYYVFEHVSDDLPMRYVLSAFWEGQEGSFLLWMFWHVILGMVLMFRSGIWESRLLVVMALIEAWLASMLLGIYLPFGDDIRIGSNPALLLRDVVDAPIFANAEYLQLIEGRGLNELLQNYWNVIHPPTLFLGFAAAAIPFCFAVAGLWSGQHKAWLKPALPWALFAAFVLGLGLIMGSAWAYEALTFGGYWAWDPVENTSLVPWLILIGGIHTHLVARNTGYSIKSTYVMYLLTFVLILYSTFLTRSGILGDTSAHAFTEMGLEWQLVGFITFFAGMGIFTYWKHRKTIAVPKKEETIESREFWMFIGALVLFFSAALISVSTSLPVFNTIVRFFDPEFQGKAIEDPIAHYNKYQMWIAVFIGILTGVAQFLRYRAFEWATFKRRFTIHLLISFVLTVVLGIVVNLWLRLTSWPFYLLMGSALFAVVANLDYLISFVRGRIKAAGSVFAHVGFGVLILGVMSSGLNSSFISSNPFAQRGIVTEDQLDRNIALIKGQPMFVNNYWVTYVNDTVVQRERRYNIEFRKVNEANETIETFTVQPNFLYTKDFTKTAAFNPDTKRYWNKDIFTQIAALPNSVTDFEAAKEMEDTLRFDPYTAAIGDTFYTRRAYGIVQSITFIPKHPEYRRERHDIGVGVDLEIRTLEDEEIYHIQPALGLRESLIYQYPDKIDALRMRVQLDESFFDQFFSREEELTYEAIALREGEAMDWKGLRVRLRAFDRAPEHAHYEPKADDVAIAAVLDVSDPNGQTYVAKPIFIVRNNQVFQIKDYIADLGLHLRYFKIDPESGRMHFNLARDNREPDNVPFRIAENVPRTDVLYLEAKVFPGINLVWLGSILMLIGLALSLWLRLSQSRKTT